MNADRLAGMLKKLPENKDENLLIGMETSDDAAVYKIDATRAIVQTLDFFTPNVDDPYLFGKIAAANSLSDIYAMGAKVLTALNIVCFPENMDIGILEEILRGGAEKVHEAGGVICGGHTVKDDEPKYGLSVTGIVDIKRLMRNNGSKIGNKIILTKPLGTGIITAAARVSEASEKAVQEAHLQMETLNKYAAETALADGKYDVSAMTDVTGFGFLGHLSEMLSDKLSIRVNCAAIPYIDGAYDYAKELLVTGLGQQNRNHYGRNILTDGIAEPMLEILFDPQTSGGLLISVANEDAEPLAAELRQKGITAAIVAEVIEKQEKGIILCERF